MQRRWAAICIAFFLVMAGGSYSVMAFADAPSVEVEGETYQSNDTFDANGNTYQVTIEGGSGSLTYNETVANEETFDNNSEVEYRDGTYNVTIGSAENPSSFTLTETFDVEAILQNDSQVDNQTYERDDGTQFVRYNNGSTQSVEEYLPEPNREQFSEGGTIDHAGETKTVDNVTSDAVTLTWETEEEQSIELEEGETFTIGDNEYVATFPANDTVVLSSDVEGYQQTQENQQYFQERLSGLNYVIIFSLVSAFLLAAMAFLPHRG